MRSGECVEPGPVSASSKKERRNMAHIGSRLDSKSQPPCEKDFLCLSEKVLSTRNRTVVVEMMRLGCPESNLQTGQ